MNFTLIFCQSLRLGCIHKIQGVWKKQNAIRISEQTPKMHVKSNVTPSAEGFIDFAAISQHCQRLLWGNECCFVISLWKIYDAIAFFTSPYPWLPRFGICVRDFFSVFCFSDCLCCRYQRFEKDFMLIKHKTWLPFLLCVAFPPFCATMILKVKN